MDNLKLGYGGTQTEMARLINDSGVLGAAITITADTVNQVPFHKIVEAIHIIQDEMEITGTTAKEASDTISGSFSSFKATWKNLLVGLASGDQDVNQLFANFTSAGKTAAKNVISVIPSFIRNLQTVLTSAAQFISTEWANTIWPEIQNFFNIQFGITLPDWESIKTNFSEKLNELHDLFGPILDKIGGTLSERVPALLSDAFTTMTTWLTNNQEEINKFVEEAGNFVTTGLDMALDFFQWTIDNADAVSAAISVISAALIAATAAAHPYVTAIAAIVAGLIEIKKSQGVIDESGVDTSFSGFWETATNNTQNGVTGLDLLKGYNQLQQMLEADPVEVGTELDPEAGGKLQSEVDAISLEAVVKLIADDSGLALNDSSGGSTQFGGTGHSFAKGLDYVPYDGFPAILHKREAVLTATQADAWRSGSMGGADVGRLETAINSLSAMMQQVVANTGRGQTIVLDSGVLVGQLAPQMDTRLGTIANRKGRRNG